MGAFFGLNKLLLSASVRPSNGIAPSSRFKSLTDPFVKSNTFQRCVSSAYPIGKFLRAGILLDGVK